MSVKSSLARFFVTAVALSDVACSAAAPLDGAAGDPSDAAVPAADAGVNTFIDPSYDAALPGDGGADASEASTGPVGDSCENPTKLTMNGTTLELPGETTTGLTNAYSGSHTCMTGHGRDHVYAVTIPAKKQLSALVESAAGFNQLVQIVVGDASKCGAISSTLGTPGSTCAIGADHAGLGETDEASYYNASDAPQNAFVIVDAAEDEGLGGTYRLALTMDSPLVGDVCETAVPITAGLLVDQSTVGYKNNYGNDTSGDHWASGCRGSAGPERVYAIDVPPSTKLTVTATASDPLDTSINIVVGNAARCNSAPRVCDGANDDGTTPEPDVAGFVNATGLTVTAFIIVDTYADLVTGTFSLETKLDAVALGTGAGETCTSPEPIVAPPNGSTVTVAGTTAGYSNDYSGSGTCMTAPGRDHVYSVSLPAGKQLYAALTSDPGFDQLVNIVPGDASACGAQPYPATPTCSVGNDRSPAGGIDRVAYYNATGSTQNVFIMADSWSADTGGMYSLAARVADPLPGEACETAESIVAGTTNSTLVDYGNNYGNANGFNVRPEGCAQSAGADRVFRIDLPAGKTLRVVVTPSDDDFDPAINLVVGAATACNSKPRHCTTNDDSGGGGEADEVTYQNKTALTQTVFIIVDTYHSSRTGDFTMTTTIE